jgi:hypothetical protein
MRYWLEGGSPGSTRGPRGYGGWDAHTVGRALERYFLGKQLVAKPLETLGVPRWKGRWKARSQRRDRKVARRTSHGLT